MTTSTGYSDISPKAALRATITGSASSIDLIAAVSGKSIRVLSMVLKVSGAGTFLFNSQATEIGRIIATSAEPAVVLNWNPDGWLQTAVGEKLNLGNAGSLTVSGFVTYLVLG